MKTSDLVLQAGLAHMPSRENGPGTGQAQTARWRYELERAQWRLKGGISTPGFESRHDRDPVLTAKTAIAPRMAGTAAPEAKKLSVGADRGLAQDSGHPTEPHEGKVSADLAAKPESTVLELLRERSNNPSVARAFRTSGLQQEMGSLSSKWPAFTMHAQLEAEGDGAHVWIRDATLDAEAKERIAATLRARLAAAGMRLHGLTVNGAVVVSPILSAAQSEDQSN